MKKVRTISELHLDKDDLTVDRNEQTVQGPGVSKALYKSTLCPVDYVFDRVQEHVERQMARPIIIKLLGEKIGFNVLLNNITLSWNPKCPIQLMDLENDFFLISQHRKMGLNHRSFGYGFRDYLRGIIRIVFSRRLVKQLDKWLSWMYTWIVLIVEGHNGVLRLQVTKSKYMDAKAKNRAKGKRVMIGVGPKSGPSALRPNNGRFGVKAIVGHGVFDDGSKLRLMGVAD
ncbi:hypothetical protein Goari_019258 [Gossypium aridum]|uniref:Uncharacterized protein n=1 Tax=Gossypium aridum TaxID=34290 RepID=A0A7J8WS56_GOSAI|nr:hypothetical protein [Gossypium aridum]